MMEIMIVLIDYKMNRRSDEEEESNRVTMIMLLIVMRMMIMLMKYGTSRAHQVRLVTCHGSAVLRLHLRIHHRRHMEQDICSF